MKLKGIAPIDLGPATVRQVEIIILIRDLRKKLKEEEAKNGQ